MTICIPIVGPSHTDVLQQLQLAKQADMVELRTDLWEGVRTHEILEENDQLFIIPIRKKEDLELLAYEPAFVDIDLADTERFIPEIDEDQAVILSYHNFEETPEDLEEILAEMEEYPAEIFKLATMAHSSLDALRMLKLVREYECLGVCMGEDGKPTRILAPVVGAPWTFAALDKGMESAPGQLTMAELCNIYHHDALGPDTKLFGLIGDPVKHSVGYLMHNEAFDRMDVDGVYVNFRLQPEEVDQFFELISEFDVGGFSVTMPLKEVVGKERAINTLVGNDHAPHNTDGPGALDALEELGPVSGKKMVILGAGGAAHAIAHEAKARGAEVVVLNRTLERAQRLASQVDGVSGELSDLPKHPYDVLIQATSVGMEGGALPVPAEQLDPNGTVLEVVSKDTPFVHAAQERGCTVIPGKSMWLNQAARQLSLWLEGDEESGASSF